ncbi:hypothetical protein F5Y18DRAFT_311324 [Xylariaceae sp. FL1019]|nr:hypothetical protein F5Y18DRAFT_311324 [Xylariaceae sp. FL1019]
MARLIWAVPWLRSLKTLLAYSDIPVPETFKDQDCMVHLVSMRGVQVLAIFKTPTQCVWLYILLPSSATALL